MSMIMAGCGPSKHQSSLTKEDFGVVEGVKVDLYTISFPGQLEAKVTNYGGIITSLKVPDRGNNFEDVVLGYDNLQGYLDETPYFGAIVGRYGNRIAKGKFELEGQTYSLAVNNGENALHGGIKGFDKVVWEVINITDEPERKQLTLKYVSPDGEEGYPGELTSIVNYIFTPDSFEITYEATTDKTTPVNLTQHSYFNLSGDAKEDILGHELEILADRFLPVDSTLIPTGELRPVLNTPFDFVKPKAIGRDINENNQQLAFGGGFDHCWVISDTPSPEMRKIARLYHPGTGRTMETYTTEPGVQFYSGNFLDGTILGKGGTVYNHRFGLCLETQHFPDSPNQTTFPSVVLKPGTKYATSTKYVFSVKPG